MKKVAVVGASGHIGNALFKKLNKDKSLRVRGVTRKNNSYWKKQNFDIVINCAMPSARYWAENNPQADFTETVEKTAGIVYDWKYKKLIQISSLSARTGLNSVYGRNKAAAEKLCNFDQNLIVRITAIYANTLSKGALIDIIKGKKVYVHKKSRYGFASLDFITTWISQNLDKDGIIEVGAKNSITLEEIASHFKLNIKFEGLIDIQEVNRPSPEFPDAKKVLSFLEKRIKTASSQHLQTL